MFPPHLLRDHNARLKVYAKEICRTVSLDYHGESTSNGIPTLRYIIKTITTFFPFFFHINIHEFLQIIFFLYSSFIRYKPPVDMFSPKEDSCFCKNKKNGIRNCPPYGVFNSSACVFGAPMLSSFPHFYLANKTMLNYVDGLEPKKKLHESYVDLHAVSAIFNGKFRK